MTTYTPGALRAAKAFHKADWADYTRQEVAEIISRETGDAGLLEALRALVDVYRNGYPEGDYAVKVVERAEKAIAQAQEGKP